MGLCLYFSLTIIDAENKSYQEKNALSKRFLPITNITSIFFMHVNESHHYQIYCCFQDIAFSPKSPGKELRHCDSQDELLFVLHYFFFFK